MDPGPPPRRGLPALSFGLTSKRRATDVPEDGDLETADFDDDHGYVGVGMYSVNLFDSSLEARGREPAPGCRSRGAMKIFARPASQ